MTFSSFGLQRQITLPRITMTHARHFLAVDVQFDYAVICDPLVMIPFAAALGAVLAGQTALPTVGMRAVRLASRAPNAEQVALTRVIIFLFQIHQDLDFDPSSVARPLRRQGIAPDEEAGVAHFGLIDMHPFHFEDEVLVLLLGAEEARRVAGGDDLIVLYEEGAGVTIHIDPTG